MFPLLTRSLNFLCLTVNLITKIVMSTESKDWKDYTLRIKDILKEKIVMYIVVNCDRLKEINCSKKLILCLLNLSFTGEMWLKITCCMLYSMLVCICLCIFAGQHALYMYKWFKNVSSKTDNRLQGSRKFNGFVRVILLIPVFFYFRLSDFMSKNLGKGFERKMYCSWNRSCSLPLWRAARGSKLMFLELIHGLFIT